MLALGGWLIFGTGIQTSISAYYHTSMRNVFVGALWVVGFFLLSYRGYERKDDIAGDFAWVFAVGTSLFPAAPETATKAQAIIGYIHWGFSAALFITLIIFSLVLFTKSGGERSRKKKQRNLVYQACGWIMAACIAVIGLDAIVPGLFGSWRPIFWMESAALIAFGVSWFVKGGAILSD